MHNGKIPDILFPAAAAAVFCVDQAVKKAALEKCRKKRQKFGICFQYTENRGFAMNIAQNRPKLVKAASLTALTAGTAALAATVLEGSRPVSALGLAMLTGGGLSNTLDRLVRHSVVDYVSFPGIHCRGGRGRGLVYNLGDFGIFAGTLLLVLDAAAESTEK